MPTFGPKYNIEFDSSLYHSRIGLCRMRNAATGQHNALTSSVGFCTSIGGLGYNVGNPNTTGNWLNQGQLGMRVRDTNTGNMWECTAATGSTYTWTQYA